MLLHFFQTVCKEDALKTMHEHFKQTKAARRLTDAALCNDKLACSESSMTCFKDLAKHRSVYIVDIHKKHTAIVFAAPASRDLAPGETRSGLFQKAAACLTKGGVNVHCC